MGQTTPHVLGRSTRYYAKAESTFGTFLKPTATDAVKALKMSIDHKQERKDRMDSRQSRSVLERITGRKQASWSMERYVTPSGSLGTAPDEGVLLKAAMGVETVNSSTSVVYTPTASQSVRGSLSLVREMPSIYMESLAGAWVEKATLKVSGSEEPKWTFEGGASVHAGSGYSTLNGALSGGETTVVVHDPVYDVNSIVKVGTSDNSGAGHQVTAVSADGLTLTVTPAVSGAQSDTSAVVPYVPAETTAGNPINSIEGSMLVDSVSVPITGFEITVSNNDKPVGDEAFSAVVSDYIPGFRDVVGSIMIRGRRDLFVYWAKRKLFTARDLQVTCGGTAGKKLRVDVDFAEFEFAPHEVPESEESTFQIPFKGLGSSGEDDVAFTYI